MKVCLETNSMFCSREKFIVLSEIQQNEKSTQGFKEKYGIEALQLLQLWEKGVIRECNYRNHRRFTLRCISKDLVPVSVKLRSACSKISHGVEK